MIDFIVTTRFNKPINCSGNYLPFRTAGLWLRIKILAASIALITSTAPVSAVDFIVDTDTVVTNGDAGNVLDGGDSLIVTESGSITVSGAGEIGIDATGPDNIIIVNGQVLVVGPAATYGILSNGDGAQITVNGTVSTGIGANQALEVRGANSVIVNNGTIHSDDSQAIYISTTAAGSMLTNTGTILTTDSGNQAVVFYSSGIAINSGLIMSTGDFDEAVDMAEGGVLENTGIIRATGLNAEAVSVRDGAIVTNSGRIISEQGEAFAVSDGSEDDDTINLLAPSFIGGIIDFGTRDEAGTQTTVNIVTGPSHSILWDIDGVIGNGAPNFSGTVPWFYDAVTQTVATFDPTLLASETAALGDLTSLLSQVGLGALDGVRPETAPGGNSALGYLPTDGRQGAALAIDQAVKGEVVARRMNRAWATVFGGQMTHEGGDTTLDADIDHLGFAAGYMWQQSPGLTLSAMAGYAFGNAAADSRWSASFDHDTHTMFTGLHGEHQFDGSVLDGGELRFGLTAGYQWIDHNRLVNDNLAALGESWVTAEYGGFFITPELAASTDIAMANGITLTPSAGLRYAAQWLDGYSESGAVNSAANATVEARYVGVLEANAELEASRDFDFGTVAARIGYLGRWNGGDDAAGITLNGIGQDVASGYQALNASYVGATFRNDISGSAFVEFDGSYLIGDTSEGYTGRLTIGSVF